MANKNRTVQLDNLAPRSIFCIRGKLTFSRVYKHIDGDELIKDKQQRQMRNLNPVNRPYTTATISDAQVLFRDAAAINDPSKRTPEEVYALEHLYMKDGKWCYVATNKSRNLPAIFVINPETKKYERVALTGNLDNGLDVTMVMRVFHAKEQNRNGVSLDQICINEPVRYYTTGLDLSDYGIITEDNTPAAAAAPTVAEPAPAAQNTGAGFAAQPAQPAPVGSYQAPVANGYATSPVNAAPPVAAAPAAPASPVAAAAPVPGPDSAFGVPAAAPAAAPAAGVQYNPATDPSRQY